MFSSYLHDNTEGGEFFFNRLVLILLEDNVHEQLGAQPLKWQLAADPHLASDASFQD